MKQSPLRLALICLPFLGLSLSAQSAIPPHSDSIVVTGTFEPVEIEELDRAVSRLPVHRDEILLNSWIDALRLDPSVDLLERAPNGAQADASIRGGSFGQTLVLVDGIRINDVQTGHHDMDMPLPLDAIDHIEVLRGSGSALYGSDAVGGAINVITRQPEVTDLHLRTAVGNFGVNQQSGTFSLVEPVFNEQISFSRDFSSGFEPDRDYRDLDFSSITRVRSTKIIAAYADKPFGANQAYGNFPSWEDTKTWLAAVSQDIGPDTQAMFSYRRHSDLFVLFRDQPQIYTNHHYDESYLGELRRTDSFSSNVRLHYGGEFDHESIVSNNLGDHARTRGSAYASLDIRALKRFSLSIGAREDVYGSVSSQFNPNVSAGYWLTSRLRLRGGVSRAFRLPTYTDLYYSDPANLGNALLKPEHAWSYEGGLEWQIGLGWRADATVFQRRDYDGIDYIRQSVNAVWQATNFDKLQFTGFEGALSWRDVDLRYTALHGVSQSLQGYYSKYAFNFPEHSAVAEFHHGYRHLLLRTRVGAEKRIDRNAYGVWDMYAAWSHRLVSPFLQLTNVTATRYQEIYGIDMPGRGIVGGVEIHAWK